MLLTGPLVLATRPGGTGPSPVPRDHRGHDV